jgi:hypothetical protein
MNWLKDFFFCNTWREFFALAVLASMAFIVVLGVVVFDNHSFRIGGLTL